MFNTGCDDVVLTKVSLPDTRAHQLLSVIKQEPQDYDSCHQNPFTTDADDDHCEPRRKILPAVTTSVGTTNTRTSSPLGAASRLRHVPSADSQGARVPNQINPSSMANLTSLSTVINHAQPSLSSTNTPPAAHSVSAATFLPQHASVAVPSLTTITPLLVSSLVPPTQRKLPEQLQQQHQSQQQLISSSLPTLINSTTQAAYGLFNACALTEHGFVANPHASYPVSPHAPAQPMASQANPRLSVFTQLVPRGHGHPSTSCTSASPLPGANQPHLSGFTGSPMRPRFSACYGHQTWASSPTSILPKTAISSLTAPMLTPTMVPATTSNSSGSSAIPPTPQHPYKSANRRYPNAPPYGLNGSALTETSSVTGTNAGVSQTQQQQQQQHDLVRSLSNSAVEVARQTVADVAKSISIPGATPSTRTPASGANQFNDPVSTTGAMMGTVQPVSSPTTMTNETCNTGDSLLWGRVVRQPDGDLQFPGIGKLLFSSPQAVLRQIRRVASSEESLSLQLPSSTVEFVLPEEAQMNNWLAPTSTDFGSRKGFHVCLCCHQAFTSRALYDSHMMRPVARILYRCHLCRGIEPAYHCTAANSSTTGTITTCSSSSGNTSCTTVTAATTNSNTTAGTFGNQTNAISDTNSNLDATNSTNPGDMECSNATTPSSSFPSPYCTVLPGGIIKAPNRCAIYSHMACVHPHQVERWALLPSLLSICPLSESAWSMPSFRPNHLWSLTEPQLMAGATTAVTSSASVSENSTTESAPGSNHVTNSTSNSLPTALWQKPNADAVLRSAVGTGAVADITPAAVTAGSVASTTAATESLDLATFYQPGMELTELWRDLERAMSESVSYQSLNFLSTHADPIESQRSSQGLPVLALSSWFGSLNASFKLDQSGGSAQCPLSRLLTRPDDAAGASPPLPEVDSSLAQTILLSACAETWKSHLFLTVWCQRVDWGPVLTADQQASKSTPIVIEDDSADTRGSPMSDRMRASADVSVLDSSHVTPPPAPSVAELHEALSQLELDQLHTGASPNGSEPAEQESDSVRCSSGDGVLRCLICQFRATSSRQMQLHLSGAQPYTLTKCALCGQSICIRQPNLCAVKAHLLLHLGCFIMCPQCGFTPPAHLAPDAGELCLRIHLRFICFHYNVLQVYLCTRCQGQGKAFHSLNHLCQHYFDRHTIRVYACLWCARQTPLSIRVPGSTTLPDGLGTARRAPLSQSEQSAAGADRSDGHRTPDSSEADRARSPERVGTPPIKPVFSFANARELLVHLRAMHRHVLTVPASSIAPSGSSSSSTVASTATSNTATGANPGAVTARPNLEMDSELDKPLSMEQSSATGDEFAGPESEVERPMVAGTHNADSLPSAATIERRVTAGEPPAGIRLGDTNSSPFCLVPMVDFTCRHKCPECNQVFENRDSFGRHFQANHPWGYTAVCCYRCFGSCKRLSYNLDEFRRHASSCPSARRMLLHTFAASSRLNEHMRAIESRSRMPSSSGSRGDSALPACSTSFATSGAPTQNHRLNSASISGPSRHPLCFCSHCGIGARRLDPSATHAAGVGARMLDSPSSPNESPADLVIDERDPDAVSENRAAPQSNEFGALLATSTNPPTAKEPVYDACYFSDLATLHAHESQLHASENTSQIACPWCGYRLSCFKRHDLSWTLKHLRSHLLRHNFASWHLERSRKWNKQVEDLPHCSCGSALLDSPLALASHGSAHLLACNPPLPRAPSDRLAKPRTDSVSSGPRLHNGPEPNDANSVASGPALCNNDISKAPASRSLQTSRQTNINRLLLRPGSGAHIPCSVDVYRHLRFAILPELDHYLSCATLSAQPFVCPVCNSSLSTRWALTEHAFIEHWGLLCFICCMHIMQSPSKSGCEIARRSDTTPAVGPSRAVIPEAVHSPRSSPEPSTDSVPTTRPDANANTASNVSVPPTTVTDTPVEEVNLQLVQDNFWTHVHQCMEKRRQDLKNAQLNDDDTDECVVTNAASDAVQSGMHDMVVYPTTNELSFVNRTNQTPQISIRSSANKPTFSTVASESASAAAPILIVSSPDTLPSSDNEQLSPRSGVGNTGSGADRSGAGDSDHTLPCLNSGESVNSQPPNGDTLSGMERDAPAKVCSNGTGTKRVKRRRLTLESYDGSPRSSHWSEASDARNMDEDSSCRRICVLCGQSQTPDSWEEHQMSHRNPHMLWNGLQLADPNHIVLSPRHTKIYRCYICNARFMSRFSCRRHMGEIHKLEKSQLNWDLLSEVNVSSQPGSGNAVQNVSLQSKFSKSANSTDLSRSRSACQPGESTEHHRSANRDSSRPPTRTRSPSRPLRLTIPCARLCPDQTDPSAPSEPSTSSVRDDSRTCVLCAIQFMSQRSLAIHKLAAHGLSD